MEALSLPPPRRSQRRRLSAALYRRPWLKGLMTLSPPAAAFVFFYLAALVALFASAFWSVDSFTGQVVHD